MDLDFIADTDKRDKVKQYLINQPYCPDIQEFPINKECKVIVIVPAFNESTYIEQLLNSFDQQKDINFSNFEVHILVNNSKEEQENIINNNVETYNKVIRHATEAKYKLFAHDFFSEGNAFANDRHSVGLIRDTGYAMGVQRFNSIQRNGILVSTDADTQISRYFIKEIINLFETSQKIIGYRGLVYYDRAEELQTGNKYWGYHELHAYFSSVVSAYLKTFVGNYKYNPPSNFKYAGANSGARSIETALVGGIPHLKGREDVHFGYKLAQLGKIVEENKIITYPSTRLEQRVGHGTGTGNKASNQIYEALKNNTLMVYSLESYINNRKIELGWEANLGRKLSLNDTAPIFKHLDKTIFDESTLKTISNANPTLENWGDISSNDTLRNIQLSIIDRVGYKESIQKVLGDIKNDYRKRFSSFDQIFDDLLKKTKKDLETNLNNKINLLLKISQNIDKDATESSILASLTELSKEQNLDELAIDRFTHSRDISFLKYAIKDKINIHKILLNLYFPKDEPFRSINENILNCLTLIETQKHLTKTN